MSFRSFVERHKGDPTHDAFLTEARTDPRMPDARHWHELEAYLNGKNAHASVIEAARLVWASYRDVPGNQEFT